MTYRLSLLVPVALTFLAACGGEGGGGAQASAPSADAPPAAAPASASTTGCPWLTSDLATGLLGADVTVDGNGQYECTITSEPNTFSARINVDPTPLGNTLDSILRPYENTAGYGGRQPISGLGEQAAWVGHARPTGGYGGLLLGVEQAGRTVAINLTPASSREDLPARAEALARAVVERM